MTKRRKDSFGFDTTLPVVTSRIIDAHEAIKATEPDRIDFQHAVLCQVGMPRRKQPERTFQRVSGTASILLQAGSLWNGKAWIEQPLPYGVKPRLAMIHVSSEAVRTQSHVVDIGGSTHDFLKRLGMDTSGRGYALFKSQMNALAACQLTLGYSLGEKAVTVDSKPFKRFEAWLNPTDQQATLWPGELELTEDFYDTLTAHAVPLDYRAIGALKHSALTLDVYSWLSHRLHRISPKTGTRVSWSNMHGQFGQEYQNPKDFKRKFKEALRQVVTAYPDAKIESVDGGLILKNSPPPISKTMVQTKRLKQF
jgi:hypothetical protein